MMEKLSILGYQQRTAGRHLCSGLVPPGDLPRRGPAGGQRPSRPQPSVEESAEGAAHARTFWTCGCERRSRCHCQKRRRGDVIALWQSPGCQEAVMSSSSNISSSQAAASRASWLPRACRARASRARASFLPRLTLSQPHDAARWRPDISRCAHGPVNPSARSVDQKARVGSRTVAEARRCGRPWGLSPAERTRGAALESCTSSSSPDGHQTCSVPPAPALYPVGGMMQVTDSLNSTMKNLCEILTADPEGGPSRIPFETFAYVYQYLTGLDPDIPSVETGAYLANLKEMIDLRKSGMIGLSDFYTPKRNI